MFIAEMHDRTIAAKRMIVLPSSQVWLLACVLSLIVVQTTMRYFICLKTFLFSQCDPLFFSFVLNVAGKCVCTSLHMNILYWGVNRCIFATWNSKEKISFFVWSQCHCFFFVSYLFKYLFSLYFACMNRKYSNRIHCVQL